MNQTLLLAERLAEEARLAEIERLRLEEEERQRKAEEDRLAREAEAARLAVEAERIGKEREGLEALFRRREHNLGVLEKKAQEVAEVRTLYVLILGQFLWDSCVGWICDRHKTCG